MELVRNSSPREDGSNPSYLLSQTRGHILLENEGELFVNGSLPKYFLGSFNPRGIEVHMLNTACEGIYSLYREHNTIKVSYEDRKLTVVSTSHEPISVTVEIPGACLTVSILRDAIWGLALLVHSHLIKNPDRSDKSLSMF